MVSIFTAISRFTKRRGRRVGGGERTTIGPWAMLRYDLTMPR
jgi:hypothetical protein